MMLAASLVAAILARAAGQPQPGAWLPAESRDLIGELDEAISGNAKTVFDKEVCELRFRLMKLLGPANGGQEKNYMMLMLLSDLGNCELKNGKIEAAKRRFESAISEFNAPNEDMMLQNPSLAAPVLLKNACSEMLKNDISLAAVQLRRAHMVLGREKTKTLKQIAKQNQVPKGQEETFMKSLREKGAGGAQGQNAQGVKQVLRLMNGFDAQLESLVELLQKLDDQMVGDEKALKERRSRVSKIASGPYTPAMLVEPLITAPPLPDAKTLASESSSIAEEVLEAKLKNSVSLIKNTKEASGCKKLPKTCGVVKGMPDVSTNGFGETRVLVLKAGKRETLELCTTNVNMLFVVPLTEGVQLDVGGGEAMPLEVKTPVVVDHCVAVGLQAGASANVLLVEAWHPEFATIERTTEVRDRGTKWGLKEDAIKELTTALNAHGKKGWNTAMKEWQKGQVTERLRERVATSQKDKEKAANAEKEKEDAEKKEEENNEEEEKRKAVEELEKKRLEKKAKAEEKERKRIENKKRMEAEAAKKDPWLLDPVVKQEQQKLEDLKQERRDANAQMEFDLTTQLTKDINAQERLLAKTIKKAKKAHRKGKTLSEL